MYALTQEQLAHTQFPLGDRTKHEVRSIAESQRFINAHKHDSQDICFVRNGSYADFIEGHTGNKYPEGNFIDCRGNILGRHHGIIRYTIGQRKGLGLYFAEPMYVISIQSKIPLHWEKIRVVFKRFNSKGYQLDSFFIY